MATPAREPATVGEEGFTPDPRRWQVLAVVLSVGFMALLDVTIVNVALPTMREGLDASTGSVQWVVSGYALAFGLTLVSGGRLGDAHGRRRLMLVGLTGFIASSALVGFAPSIELAVVARLAQGASAGILTPQSSGLIQQLFRGPERGRAFGLFGLTVAIASAAGPVIGGLIIALAGPENGWRWLFLVNVPLGLVALVAIARLVPAHPAEEQEGDTRLDGVGALLLGATVLAVLFPVVQAENGARLPLLLLLLAPLLGWAFVRWEHRVLARGHAPLLDVALLRSLPGYGIGMAIGSLYFCGFTGIFLVVSVHLQDDLGLSALETGLLLTPFALGAAVTSPVAGRLVSTVGRPLTVIALVVMMTGTALTAWLAADRTGPSLVWVLVPCLLLAGLGSGAVVSPNFTLTLAEVPPRMGGAAGAALQTGQRIGASLGAALLVTVYQLAGLRSALLVAVAVIGLALVAAVVSWRAAPRAATTPSGG